MKNVLTMILLKTISLLADGPSIRSASLQLSSLANSNSVMQSRQLSGAMLLRQPCRKARSQGVRLNQS